MAAAARLLRCCAAASAVLGAVLCLGAWRRSGPQAQPWLAGRRRLLGPGPPAPGGGGAGDGSTPVASWGGAEQAGPASALGGWHQIGPCWPIWGAGCGDCSGCRDPVESEASKGLQLADCQEWVEKGCPSGSDGAPACPSANALGYRMGGAFGESHLCRAWACDAAAAWDGNAAWICFAWDGSPGRTTSLLTSGSSSSSSSSSTTSGTTTSTALSSTSFPDPAQVGSSTGAGPTASSTTSSTATPAVSSTATSSTSRSTSHSASTVSSTATSSTSRSASTATPTSSSSTTSRPPAPTAAPTLPPGPQCSEHPNKSYTLDWRAQGRSFFDDWAFLLNDYNNGAAEYMDRVGAEADGVVEAHDTHAILRTGPRGARFKRKSAKIATHRTWKYALLAMRFTHTPWGCGLWPAFWTHAPGFPWPEGGELDILEYVNDIPSQTSFHSGTANKCQLDGGQINRPGCPVMPDLNGMNYDCTTAYPLKLGCAVNRLPLLSPHEWARFPSVVAVEWTERFLKIFVIPESEIPADLHADAPRPDSWEHWLAAYYPFALSEERWNGTCANPGDVLQPQQLVININFCGDWAGKVWPLSPSCANRVGPAFPYQCRAVDPLVDTNYPAALAEDCCTQFIYDENGTYGTDEYLAERAYFNISWIKVYKQQG